MEKTMKEVIKENHTKSNLEYQESLKRLYKIRNRRERLDKALGYLIGAFIIVISGLCIYLLSQTGKNFVDSCTSQGYSKNYCIQHM